MISWKFPWIFLGDDKHLDVALHSWGTMNDWIQVGDLPPPADGPNLLSLREAVRCFDPWRSSVSLIPSTKFWIPALETSLDLVEHVLDHIGSYWIYSCCSPWGFGGDRLLAGSVAVQCSRWCSTAPAESTGFRVIWLFTKYARLMIMMMMMMMMMKMMINTHIYTLYTYRISYIYIYICIHYMICIYTYMFKRERERERDAHIYAHTHIYIYIYPENVFGRPNAVEHEHY